MHKDTDNDGVPDYHDSDDDNDGIPDKDDLDDNNDGYVDPGFMQSFSVISSLYTWWLIIYES